MQRHIRIGIFLLTLAVVFFFARSPVSQNVDFWVHLKLGELQSSKGILHKDLLSFVTSGREAYPQQWLFQIFVYRYVQVFGLQNAQYIASISGVLFVFVLWCLFRKVLNSSLWESIFAIAVFFIGTIDFLNLRAQMFAYFFAVCAFSLIFLYIKKGRNYLWLTVPLMIVWNNIHASLFLAIYFFASYAVLQFFLKGRSKAKVLLMYVLCGLLISVLPPLGTGQWRYLWFFVQHRKVVDSFGEWLPLYRSFADFIVYVFFCICAALVWIIRLREKKVSKNEVVFLPLVLLVFSAFFALRNLFLGYICISILFAQGIRGLKLTRIVRVALFLILIGMLWVFWQKETNDVAHVPQRASDFIRAQNIRGKMFSDFVGSSYFLWSLAPERKIFMDIRLELYACCELPEYEHAFLDKVNASDGDFFASVDAFFASYGFDYAVLPTDQNSFWRRIDEHLLSLPQWSLVYWD
ncbi:MAG TPA: hypothetical protein VLH19_03770, partial [Patescibacteria group bacterium]|nr:hypothetical protein [Patescibacteria group bacterium]